MIRLVSIDMLFRVTRLGARLNDLRILVFIFILYLDSKGLDFTFDIVTLNGSADPSSAMLTESWGVEERRNECIYRVRGETDSAREREREREKMEGDWRLWVYICIAISWLIDLPYKER